MLKNNKIFLIGAIISSILFTEAAIGQTQSKAPQIRGKVWFNTGEYKKPGIKAFLGKVVLVFFWTSGDASCERAVIKLKNWYSQYQQKGLEIIAVHAFEWESRSAESELFKIINRLRIQFPVVMEEGISTRTAYEQLIWPSICLVDRGGYIRARYSGILTFRDIEIMLKALLEEGKSDLLLRKSLAI